MSRRGRGRRDARRPDAQAGRGPRPGAGRAAAAPAPDDDREVSRAVRLARILAGLCLAIAVLLLLLAALGRGTPYLLGALDFAVIGGALAWIGWRDPGGRPGPSPPP